jgi:hypothetical protein
MKIVRENINEKFTEEGDPIEDMGIGTKAQILKELPSLGLTEKDIKFEKDGTFFLSEGLYHLLPYHLNLRQFIELQLKYFPFAQKVLLHNLNKSKLDIAQLIEQARADGLTVEQIQLIIEKSLDVPLDHNHIRYNSAKSDLQKAKLCIYKLKRTKKQAKEDEDNNVYVFIGFTEKVPVTVNGKKYYEDKLGTENIVKIDKFNPSDLQMIPMMKIRAQAQYGGKGDYGVYMIMLPKDLMNDDAYYKIPEEYYDIFVKYAKKI